MNRREVLKAAFFAIATPAAVAAIVDWHEDMHSQVGHCKGPKTYYTTPGGKGKRTGECEANAFSYEDIPWENMQLGDVISASNPGALLPWPNREFSYGTIKFMPDSTKIEMTCGIVRHAI